MGLRLVSLSGRGSANVCMYGRKSYSRSVGVSRRGVRGFQLSMVMVGARHRGFRGLCISAVMVGARHRGLCISAVNGQLCQF